MGHEERRDAQPEQELECFPGRETEVTALVERRQRQHDMSTQRTVEGDSANGVAPHEEEPVAPCFHRL
jgi:hypothetical protein